MTCGARRRDTLSHVLYGANVDFVARLVEECVINVGRAYPSPGVADALQELRPCEGDSLHCLQIKFFLLLNEDEVMRRNVGSVREKGQSGAMLVCSLCPYKAERFYDALCDELVPLWMKDCRITQAQFVDQLRRAYLCS